MSRSGYSDEFGDDFPGQTGLYRANVRRSVRGSAGQARLRELRDALEALPVKALHDGIFAEGTNDHPAVCALGAWALQKTGDTSAAQGIVTDPDSDVATADSLAAHGWPKLVVFDTIYENDRDEYTYVTVEGPHLSPYAYYGHRWPVRYRVDETPEQRYARVLAWVSEQIIEADRG
jgi:hypothetical protein